MNFRKRYVLFFEYFYGMKIEIWSDIVCPFCYIGKRHLEAALTQFPAEDFEIEWKSFQLNPATQPQPGKDVYTYLAEQKGISVAESKAMHQNVVDRAAEVGLDYHFEKAIVTNSLNMHRILHLAKRKNVGDQMKELFLKSYFMDGKDLNDAATLLNLATQVGLDQKEVEEVLQNPNLFLNEVQHDIEEAREIGVQGVPFFVFDRKYAVSGAQPVDAFVKTIQEVIQNDKK